MPYTLSGGVLLTNAFKDAFILPVAAPSIYWSTNTPFERNLNNGIFYTHWLDVINAAKDLVSTEDCWAVCLLACWQGPPDKDRDPDYGASALEGGDSNPASNAGAIYVEVVRECENRPYAPRTQEEHTIVHELGHQGGGEHSDGGILEDGAPAEYNNFAPITIRRFRLNDNY